MTEVNTRGEVSIKLQGVPHVMRPSYEAIQAVQSQLGMNEIGIINALHHGRLLDPQLAIVVTEFVKAWGREAGENADPIQRSAAGVNAEKVGKLMFESGKKVVMELVSLLLAAAVNGGCELSGELKPAP